MSNCGLWSLHEEQLPIEVFDRSKLYFAAWGFPRGLQPSPHCALSRIEFSGVMCRHLRALPRPLREERTAIFQSKIHLSVARDWFITPGGRRRAATRRPP